MLVTISFIIGSSRKKTKNRSTFIQYSHTKKDMTLEWLFPQKECDGYQWPLESSNNDFSQSPTHILNSVTSDLNALYIFSI